MAAKKKNPAAGTPTRGYERKAPKVVVKGTDVYSVGARAGKAKSSRSVRQQQNKKQGVKEGDIRLGKAGKSINVYDAKSGTWRKTTRVAGGIGSKSAPKPKATAGGTPLPVIIRQDDVSGPKVRPVTEGTLPRGGKGVKTFVNAKTPKIGSTKVLKWGRGSATQTYTTQGWRTTSERDMNGNPVPKSEWKQKNAPASKGKNMGTPTAGYKSRPKTSAKPKTPAAGTPTKAYNKKKK